MYHILNLNPISPVYRDCLNANEYTVAPDAVHPDAIIVRSAQMHEFQPEPNTLMVARAGVGVNNIPLDAYAEQGIVVVNSPGANANAVKELVIAGMLIGSRDVVGGIEWAKDLIEKGNEVEKLVEKGKGMFTGPELKGKTVGIIGLGAVGLKVANACVGLEMNVIGFDPYISVEHAWMLSRAVRHARTMEEIIETCDYISIHVPLTDQTRGTLNADFLGRMKDGAVLLNFSRGELAVPEDIIAALGSGKLRRYVCDFPTAKMLGIKNAICIPHLGASTPESEDNCVRMVAEQIDAYLKTGTIINSVNFPNCDPGRVVSPRLTVLHENVPNIINAITTELSVHHINIENMANRSRGKFAYTVLDLLEQPDASLIQAIDALGSVYRTRLILPE